MDDKGKGKGLNLNNLRMDPEDIIGRVKREYVYEQVNKKSRPVWLEVMIGILAAVLVITIARIGFVYYTAWEVNRMMERSIENSRMQQIERERLRIEEDKRQERLQQFNSPQCQFWRNHYNTNRDERSLENVRRYCPQ